MSHLPTWATYVSNLRECAQLLRPGSSKVITFLDKIEEFRSLSSLERSLRTQVSLSLHRHNALAAVYWRQRAKIKDCVLGDENTDYFHLCSTIRLRKNQIKSLNIDGSEVSSHSGKHRALRDYFKLVIGTPIACSIPPNLNELVSGSRLRPSQSLNLTRPFSLEEIKTALFDMNDNASPGPDGFGPAFYKANWDLVKNDLLSLLNSFYSCSADLRRINKASLSSSPKNLAQLTLTRCVRFPFKNARSNSAPSALLLEFSRLFVILSMRINPALSKDGVSRKTSFSQLILCKLATKENARP